MGDDGSSLRDCPIADWPTCEHIHYMPTVYTNTIYPCIKSNDKSNLVTIKIPDTKPDKSVTYSKARNPMIRTDKKLQRGF